MPLSKKPTPAANEKSRVKNDKKTSGPGTESQALKGPKPASTTRKKLLETRNAAGALSRQQAANQNQTDMSKRTTKDVLGTQKKTSSVQVENEASRNANRTSSLDRRNANGTPSQDRRNANRTPSLDRRNTNQKNLSAVTKKQSAAVDKKKPASTIPGARGLPAKSASLSTNNQEKTLKRKTMVANNTAAVKLAGAQNKQSPGSSSKTPISKRDGVEDEAAKNLQSGNGIRNESDTEAIAASGVDVKMNSDIEEEEYESDFEEYTSSSTYYVSESLTDSEEQSSIGEHGNEENGIDKEFIKADVVHSAKQLREIEDIRQAMMRENDAVDGALQKPGPSGLSSQGKKESNRDVEETIVPRSGTSMIARRKHVNFSAAKKTRFLEKSIAKTRSRGELLLQMIRLDTVQFSLFETAPVNYDVYMKSFGRANTMQALVQTNDDSLTQEIQTDEISLVTKWTQKPIACDLETLELGGFQELSQHYLGVGGEAARVPLPSAAIISYEMLGAASKMMINVLEARLQQKQREQISSHLSFSQSMMQLGLTDLPFLALRSVTHAFFHASRKNVLLTVHTLIDPNDQDTSDCKLYRSLICVWNITEPSVPQHILVSSEKVTCSCSGFESTLIFAGLEDGYVAIWDTRDVLGKIYSVTKEQEYIFCTASFLGGWMSDDKNSMSAHAVSKHSSSVVAIDLVPVTDSGNPDHTKNLYWVCSMEEQGIIHIWAVHYRQEKNQQSDRVRLRHTATVTLDPGIFSEELSPSSVRCYAMKRSTLREHLFVGTDRGWIAHCRLDNGRAKPEYFRQDISTCGAAKSIELCPFQEPFFLVGTQDGKVRWHSANVQKSLMEWDVPEGEAVVSVQWSRSRPCVIFILDEISRVHIWDLAVGDVQPVETILVEGGKVTAMTLSEHDEERGIDLMVLSQDSGTTEVHQINSTYSAADPVARQEELEVCLRYLSVIANS